MTKTLLIDVSKCNGCFNCFLACRDEYYGNDYPGYSVAQPLNGQLWMQIREIERGVYPHPKLSYIPLPCLHCRTAPCEKAGKNGAVYRREDGIVMIDPEKAKGQKEIVNACPYRVVFWNDDLEIPQKCTLCAHRLDEGEKQPRCVESCPTGALVFGDVDDPASEISRQTAALDAEEFHPEFQARPLVKHVGLPKRFITGEVVFKNRQGECASGVRVKLEGSDVFMKTVTDAFGEFEFEGLEKGGSFNIAVEQPGYRTRLFEVTTATDVNLGEIILEPA